MSSQVRLLIVDDSMIMRNRIARAVADERLAHVTVVGLARDGEEALRIGEEKRPDLVTMDLTMPKLDGAECISALITILPNVKILVVSALSDKITAIKAIKRGAHGFLHKPFDDEAIVNALRQLSKL